MYVCRLIFIQTSKAYLIYCVCICLSSHQKASWSLRWIDVLITQAFESPRFCHISVTLRFSHRAKLRGTIVCMCVEPPSASQGTGNQLYKQRKHRQPVIQATQARATSLTGNPGTSNQLYKQRMHMQSVIQATQAQATSYTRSASTGNHLHRQLQLYRQRQLSWMSFGN